MPFMRRRVGRQGYAPPTRLAVLALVVLRSLSQAATSELRLVDQKLGDGVLLPGHVWIAADATLEAKVPRNGPDTVEVDDLSLLIRHEPTTRLAFFAELRLEDLVELAEGRGANTGSGDLVLERLYAEILITPRLTARVGKVYTPFGLWNEVRRAPLTWTVERPAATDTMFPEHMTGLSLRYQTTWHAWTLDATTYGPAQDELTFRHSGEKGWLMGTRIDAGRALGKAFASVGLNAAGFERHPHAAWTTATGLDLEIAVAGTELTGELTFRVPSGGGATRQGAYLQDLIPLSRLLPDLYAVVRVEQFQPGRGSSAVGQLVGLFWRPVPCVVVRADYTFATRRLERLDAGLHGSLSVLL